MERLWYRVYRNVKGNPYWLPLAVVAFFVVIAVPVTVLTLLIGDLYVDFSWSESIRIMAVATACEVAAMAFALIYSRKRNRAILAWIRQSDERPSPEEAWNLMVQIPSWLLTPPFVLLSVLHLAITDVYAANVADLSLVGYFAVALIVQTAVILVWMLLAFWMEFVLRPAVEEVDAELPAETERPALAWSLRTRLLLPIPVVAAIAGLITGGFTIEFADSEDGQLLAASLVSVLAGVFLTLIIKGAISDPLIRPIAELTTGARRVGRGDISEPVPVIGGDELGALTATFNEMQLGLREREALRTEREELLEEVLASRSRIVAASDAERRRVERNLHDGAQQRLVSLALQLSLLEAQAAAEPDLASGIAAAKTELSDALSELRDLARGLHPQVLSTGGLKPALEQLGGRSPVPVTIDATGDRFLDSVESTAYFVASEALANVAKYAGASRVELSAATRNGDLVVAISDDGVGGADAGAGSGLTGLADRVAALDGRLSADSPPGQGTRVTVEIPLTAGPGIELPRGVETG